MLETNEDARPPHRTSQRLHFRIPTRVIIYSPCSDQFLPSWLIHSPLHIPPPPSVDNNTSTSLHRLQGASADTRTTAPTAILATTTSPSYTHQTWATVPTAYVSRLFPCILAHLIAQDYQNPLHRHTSRSSHHSAYRHPSHSSHHLPQYVQSAHSHQSHTRSHSHSRPHAPTYHYPRERTPSMSDRIRNFFGMETRPDHYSQHHHPPHYPSHQYAHSNDHRRRHNSFSGFRDDSRPHRSNSVRAGPWFFGSVDNRRYIDEHGREVDHHGRVIHRM